MTTENNCTVSKKPNYVIMCGPDPNSKRGGIGVVMPGYLAALDSQNISHEMLVTYWPGRLTGKWLPWLLALLVLPFKIVIFRISGFRVVVYSHAGALPSMLREFVILLVARICGANAILHTHTSEMARYVSDRFLHRLVRVLFSPANTVCALTPWWRTLLVDARVTKRVVVIPNPLPPDLYERANAPMRSRSEKNKISVLTMTRLVAGKGVDIAIRALVNGEQTHHLVIAGDGDEKPELEKLVNELDLERRVHFAGWVTGRQKTQLLEEADIFCLPSTYDVFPMSVVEAFAFGLPVVAAKWGGIPDLVEDGQIGILTEPGDADNVAAALTRLDNPAKREEMGEMAKKHVLDLCSIDKVGKLLDETIAAF